MPQARKPIPKTQQELSNELSGASTSLLGDPNLANPNFAGPNRSLQNSFEDDIFRKKYVIDDIFRIKNLFC